MSFDPKQFREEIIRPTLILMDMGSLAAENLLMGTMAQESHFGKYIKQLGNGPALGIYQMEPNTHNDIVNNYIKFKNQIKRDLNDKFGYKFLDSEILKYDLRYATVFCRLHYRRVPKPLPNSNNVMELARYWKKYYNTHLGAGTEKEFIHNYEKFIGDN
jgi:hypothetical protein